MFARSDHNSPFAHPVRCMDPLRLNLRKIYAQHVPTQLSRVDKILSKHEGTWAALIVCFDLQIQSIVDVCTVSTPTKFFGCPDRYGTPSLSLLQLSRWERFDRRMLSRRHAKAPNVNVQKKIYMTQNLVALVRIGGIWRRGVAVAVG